MNGFGRTYSKVFCRPFGLFPPRLPRFRVRAGLAPRPWSRQALTPLASTPCLGPLRVSTLLHATCRNEDLEFYAPQALVALEWPAIQPETSGAWSLPRAPFITRATLYRLHTTRARHSGLRDFLSLTFFFPGLAFCNLPFLPPRAHNSHLFCAPLQQLSFRIAMML